MNREDSQHRLTSLDEWGDRKFIIPAIVRGTWHRRRRWVHAVLLAVFVSAPWIKINGLQSIWLDVPARRFTILGRVFMAHDAPMLFFILGILALTLALVTALWGRVWCGWSCPQTVFVESVYRRIEQWIEGDYLQRRRLNNAPLSLNKLTRRSLKWLAFFIVSSILAHSFIAYFAGAEPLSRMIRGAPDGNWGYFLIVTFVTSLLAFNFGWFREQFCIIMCPYGRFQSVLMDEESMTVTYDQARGEPRRRSVPVGQKLGDCISCNRCVEVCPTGIDIRNGAQMECIGCTACIDACDETMKNINKPARLISYSRQKTGPARLTRPRVLVNLILLVVLTVGFGYSLATQEPFYASVQRANDKPYQVMANGDVVNHFKIHIQNQSAHLQTFDISLLPQNYAAGLLLTQTPGLRDVEPGRDLQLHFFIAVPPRSLDPTGEFVTQLILRDVRAATKRELPLKIIGPRNL